MNLNVISLIITGVVLFIIALSALIGITRGFKKSLWHGLFNLLLVVVLLIFTKTITSNLINVNLTSFNIVIEGETVTSINQYIVNLLQSNEAIADLMQSSTEALELVLSLPVLIVSPILFTLLFWVIKLLEFVLSLIVGFFKLLFLPFRKKRKHVLDKNGKPIRKSKHRLVGGLIGLVIGLIVVFATFMPVFGVASVFNNLNKIKIGNDTQNTTASITLYADDGNETNSSKTLFTELLGEESLQYLDAYNNCIGINVARFTGVESLGTVAFNSLTTAKIEKTKIKLNDEINCVIDVYNNCLTISNYFEQDTLDKEQMGKLIDTTDKVINKVFDSNTIQVLGKYLLPEIIDGMLNNPDYFIKLPEDVTKDQATKIIVEAVLNSLKDTDFTNVKNTLLDVTSTLRLINDNNILTPIYNSSKTGNELTTEDYFTLIKNTNSEFSDNLSEKLTSISLINDITPSLVDGMFTAIFTSLDLDYTTNNISKEKATNVFNTIISKAVNLIKTFDTTKDYFITTNSFENIGNILNLTKDTSVLTNAQYNSLVTKLQTELKNIELPINITTAINNLAKVNNWSEEANKISLAFSDFETVYLEIKNMENLDIAKLNLTGFGILFDKLENTTIFGDGAVKETYNDLLDLSKENAQDFGNVFDTLKITETEINWEKELTALKPLLNEILGYQNKTFTDTERAIEILDLCAKFDEVEQDTNSVIYSAKMQSLLEEVLKSVKTMSANEEINGLVDDVLVRLNNRSTETLETCVLKGIFDYSTTLIPDASTFSDENIRNMISEIKNNIANLDNISNVDYRQELDYMLDFADIVSKLQNFENLTDNEITETTEFLDTLTNSTIFNNTKTHIINFVIDTAVSSVSDDKFGIITLLEELKETTPVDISTLLEDMNTIKDNALTLNVDTNDVENLNTENISSALELVRNTETFTDSFTNTIMKNILSNINENAQNDSLMPTDKKAEINSFVANETNKLDTETITNTTYKTILDNLKNLFTA